MMLCVSHIDRCLQSVVPTIQRSNTQDIVRIYKKRNIAIVVNKFETRLPHKFIMTTINVIVKDVFRSSVIVRKH